MWRSKVADVDAWRERQRPLALLVEELATELMPHTVLTGLRIDPPGHDGREVLERNQQRMRGAHPVRGLKSYVHHLIARVVVAKPPFGFSQVRRDSRNM